MQRLLEKARAENVILEARQAAEDDWTDICDRSTEGNMMKEAKSWFFGYNVPGKHHSTVYYFTGLNYYRDYLEKALKADLEELKRTPAREVAAH